MRDPALTPFAGAGNDQRSINECTTNPAVRGPVTHVCGFVSAARRAFGPLLARGERGTAPGLLSAASGGSPFEACEMLVSSTFARAGRWTHPWAEPRMGVRDGTTTGSKPTSRLVGAALTRLPSYPVVRGAVPSLARSERTGRAWHDPDSWQVLRAVSRGTEFPELNRSPRPVGPLLGSLPLGTRLLMSSTILRRIL